MCPPHVGPLQESLRMCAGPGLPHKGFAALIMSLANGPSSNMMRTPGFYTGCC